MKKFLLITVICILGGFLSGDHISVDFSNADWQARLAADIRKNPRQKHFLDISMKDAVIPKLPATGVTVISVWGHYVKEPVSLAPLADFKLNSLNLRQGSFRDLPRLDLSVLSNLAAEYSGQLAADELSGCDFPALRSLHIDNLSGETLDLSNAPHLEKLSLGQCDHPLRLVLHPRVKLKRLALPGEMIGVLKDIDLAELEALCLSVTRSDTDYSIFPQLRFPKLEELRLSAAGCGTLKLPPLPELRTLAVVSWENIDLEELKRHCPRLRELELDRVKNIANWQTLRELPLARLHIGVVGGAKYFLPAEPPRGCLVSGMPSFVDNPYKMWPSWAAAVLLFALWTLWYQRKNGMKK